MLPSAGLAHPTLVEIDFRSTGLVIMKILRSLIVPVLVAASSAVFAQAPAPQPAPQPAAAPKAVTPAAAPVAAKAEKVPDRTEAYYHFQLGHMYEEMAATTGRGEDAAKAIAEYKLAIAADPGSTYLASALADIYARAGQIRDAVLTATDIISRDPDNLEARRLLGRVYLRSIGDQQGSSKESSNILHLAIEQFEAIVRLDPKSMEDHLLLGRLYRLNNETAKAEVEIRVAVKLQPASEEAVTTLAVLYNEEGDTARAADILTSVPEEHRSPRIYTVLGYTLEQRKEFKKAVEAYRQAVKLDPDNLDAVRGLAENLLNDNQPAAALEQLNLIAASDPQDAQTFLRMSEIYRHEGQYDKAYDALKKSLAAAPDSMEAKYNLAVVEEARGHFDESATLLRELLAASDKPEGRANEHDLNNRAIFLERLGTVYRDQNKTKPAVEAFHRMTELGDEFASRGYQQIIETYRDVHDNPSATEAAREGAKLLPKDRSLQLALAQQEADSGKADEAIARVRAMLDGKPADDREVWINIAQIESRLRHYGEAEKAVAHALELSQKPEEREFINFLAGSIYERQKKYDEAESYFRKVLADDARNAAALNYLGYMLVDHGTRLDEALAMIRKAVSLDPQNAAYLDSLGWAYFRLGRYEEAESELRKASERLESDPTVHQHLGDLYQKTNRLKLAVAEWERSLEEWKKSVPADQDAAEIAKTQKKLDGAKVKLAKHGEQPAQ